jgi:hypothetical protein
LAAVSAPVIDCALTRNKADHGGAVYGCGYETWMPSPTFVLIMVNCTISENTATVGGAVDCVDLMYIFQCTVTNNTGSGVHAGSGKAGYLYNCIVAGNTSAQIAGAGTIDLSFGNLVAGENIPGSSPPVVVVYRHIFGVNKYEETTGTHRVLINGIAPGAATAITAADLAATDLQPQRQNAVLTALVADQTGAARPSPSVTYGATEGPANTVIGLAVTTQPDKAVYGIGETLDLTGTKLTLSYTNGAEVFDYFEPGVVTDASGVDMNTVGSYTVYFIYWGFTSDPGAFITVVDISDTETMLVAAPPSPQPYGTIVTLTATVTSASPWPLTGTVEFFDGTVLLGTATLTGGTASRNVSGLSVGTHSFTAVYSGSSIYNGSVSPAVPYEITENGGGGGGGSFSTDDHIVKVYGDPNFFIVTRGGPAGPIIWRSSDTSLLAVDMYTGEITINGATNGKIVVITATKGSATASTTVTVLRKPITVTADDKVKHIGEPDPPLTFTVFPGLLPKDEGILIGSLKCVGSGPGRYDIVEDTPFSAEPNYEITFVKGTMTTLGGEGFAVCCCLWLLILLIIICSIMAHRLYLEHKRRKREKEGSDT